MESYPVKGVTLMEYLTEEDYRIAAQNGISRAQAYQRYYLQGMSKKRTISEPIRLRRKVGLYRQYRKQCEENGVVEGTFYRRVREGMSPEEACSFPPVPPGNHKPHKGAKLSAKHFEIAARNGLKKGTVEGRVYMYKWTVEEAITIPVGGKRSVQ